MMNDDCNETPGPFGRPCTPRSNEHLWRVHKDHRIVDAELRYHAEHGVEVQLLINGTVTYGRRWPTRALVVAEADEQRRELECIGWN
jgi:hypothetical protein